MKNQPRLWQFGVISDSGSVLVKDAGMDGSGFIDEFASEATFGDRFWDELSGGGGAVWGCAIDGASLARVGVDRSN